MDTGQVRIVSIYQKKSTMDGALDASPKPIIVLATRTAVLPRAMYGSSGESCTMPVPSLRPNMEFAASTPVTYAFSWDQDPCLERTKSLQKYTFGIDNNRTSGMFA